MLWQIGISWGATLLSHAYGHICAAGGGADARTKRKAGATALTLLERSSKIMTSGLKTKAVVEQENSGSIWDGEPYTPTEKGREVSLEYRRHLWIWSSI